MSSIQIAGSSLGTSLARYRRSWGLWLLLLVAPVGARFMISNEDGQGVMIAIGGHLPILTSSMLGVWLGIVVSTLLLPIGYIYLRSNTNRKQPWQVEEVTSGSRGAIMLGRFVADVAVLFAMLAALTAAGWFLGFLLVTGPLDLWAIAFALWLIAGPPLMGLAALRILFDAVPLLRRGLGDLVFFVLWIASLITPVAVQDQASSLSTNLYDFPGFIRPLVGDQAVAGQDIAIGGTELKPGRVALDVDRGLAANGYIASRAVWALIAVALAAFAGLIYRPHRLPKRAKAVGMIAKLLAQGPPPPADPSAPAAQPSALPFVGLVLAELRLVGAGKLFKLLAIVAAFAGMIGDYRHIGSPAALLLLAFALSAHAGRSRARGLLNLSATTLLSPIARRIAFLLAGVGWSLLMAVPAGAFRLSPEPLILALATGATASAIAIALASISRSDFAPRIVLLIIWYAYLST